MEGRFTCRSHGRHALVRWSHKLLSPTRRVNQHRGHSLVSAPTKSLRHTIGNVNNTKRVAATLGQSGGSVPIRLATGRVRAVPAGGTSIREPGTHDPRAGDRQ